MDEVLNAAAAMRGESVPDHQKPSGKLPHQMAQEIDDLREADSAGIESEIESPPSDARDDGQFAPVEIERQLRGLPFGSPRPRDRRALAQSAFIDENDGPVFVTGFFFRAGQVYRFQRAMASSSRSAARPSGFWQLHPIRPKSFHTCAGW